MLKSTFESSVDGIHVVDINGKVLFSNSKFARMWRIPEEFIKENSTKLLMNFVSEQLQAPEVFLSDMNKLYNSTESRMDNLYFKDGRVFERNSTPLLSNGVLKGRVWSFRDVTCQRDAEEALINEKIRAEEANRTKTEFLATMSHELRTPLNSIIGFSDILLTGMYGPVNERQLKYLENISKSGNHLLDIINEILDISKIESGNESLSFKYTEVVAIFEDVKNISFPLATSKNISLIFSVEPEDMYVYVDKIKFKQILHNLVSNALKFTPKDGRVEVTAKRLQDSVEISVRDSGIGIAKDKQELIFEPFKQVDSTLSREYDGTGLGLAIVNKFVKMHEGDICVESDVDKGTTFTVSLPLMNCQESVFQTELDKIGD
ncbi:MAG: PAS domain-containing sensor histidine kinase [Methanosarcinaceae archaeon]|nr:PAS domain-containing sensor histidine kinase [Methanosarcinaceae archaeon]